jgi:RNA polymerase sigma-70 factor (ECF subfamily)
MNDETTSPDGAQVFPATRWTVVLAAGGKPSPESTAALERLCASYWYPLYAFVRRSGHSPCDAEDLTQGFFARLLEHNWIAQADRHKGRFRSFLLMAMKRFLAKEWGKARTLKRGGKVRFVPLQFDTAETRYAREPADTRTPEQVFERHWAMTLLSTVLKRLRQEYGREGKAVLFDTLEPCLIGRREMQPYAALACQLQTTEGAVKMAVCRLREGYRECLKQEIAQTVASPTEVEDELRHLFRVLARR